LQTPKPALFVHSGGERGFSAREIAELARTILGRGAAFRFRAVGRSMSPFIRDGDVLTIQPLRRRQLRQGLVVAFIHPATGNFVVHRIIRRRNDRLSVQGDNIPNEFDEIPEEAVIGFLARVERDGKMRKLGLGSEGWLIAGLNRQGLFKPLRAAVSRITPQLLKRIA